MTEVVAALIWDENRFLACQRPAHKARGLLWEFVGGKVEPGETKAQALIRECQEELAVTVAVQDAKVVVFDFLRDSLCNRGVEQRQVHSQIGVDMVYLHEHIITVEEIDQYEFCPADEEILRRLKEA